ncbi:MAG TPA: hypothetical protein VEY70_01310 [Metabacillus sp.]|nr:hypothetical protein [Metabacillus sp.]
MSSNDIKRNDPNQLQQKIIYYRSELAKYKARVEDYENNYHYSQLRLLKQENIKLIQEKEQISIQFEEIIENLRGQIQSYSDQEKELNNLLLNHKQEIEKLQHQNTNYQETISEFQAKQKDYKINIKNMNMEIRSLHARLTLQQTELEKLQDKSKDLLSKNHKQKETINDYKYTNENLTQQIENLNIQKQTDNNRMTEFEKLSNDLKDKNSKLESSITKLVNERHAEKLLYKEKIEKLTKENKEFQETNSRLKKLIEDYKTEIDNTTKEIQSLSTQLTQKQTDFEDLQDNYIILQQENKKQKETINDNQSTKKDLTLQIKKCNEEIQTYKHQMNQLEKLSNDLKDENNKLDTYIKKVESERNADKLLYDEKNKQMNSLQNDLKLFRNEKEQLEKRNLDLLQEKKSSKFRLDQLEKTDKIREKLEKELKEQVIFFQKSLEETQKQHLQLEKVNGDLQKENITLISSSEKLKQELILNKNFNNELNGKIHDLQKENERKDNVIKSYDWLQEEMKNLISNQNDIFAKLEKVQLDISSFIPKFTLFLNKDHEFSTLIRLEEQFKQILEDSFIYEEKLDSKSKLINELENKLIEMTNEIDELHLHNIQKKSD